MNARRFAGVAAIALAVSVLVAARASASPGSPDYDLPDHAGHFYSQANGQGGQGGTGFAITNADGIPFWDAYRALGGPDALGYPVSRRFTWDGFTVQAMQKVVFQWHPETRQVMFVNVLDRMHVLGKDGWLQAYRQTPPPFDSAPDAGLAWSAVTRRHWAFLDQNPAIKARYWQDADPLAHFGLPVSYADEGTSFVVRAQRAVFQYWNVDVPWARRGQVTIANAGDLAKEADLFPPEATTPEAPPSAAAPAAPPSHDWRTPGFVADVGGQLYDPGCVPFQSVGANAPNLPYHAGIEPDLDWMLAHHVRWLRVFATGHALGSSLAPHLAADAVAAIGTLLARVDAFNAAHDPSESIYVLVSLTDYYPPGVPGDRYAYDHPFFFQSPALPAPWFRAGVASFSFDQEHNLGRVDGLPNYEVNYKPWARQIVSSLASSHALLGWQLGNELKARGSPRNGISSAQAYGWYRDFTRDMVDTIRASDRNHLIFMGAQYVAELVDWEYRPNNQLDPDRVATYRTLVQQMLDACTANCWNVWSLTDYDFNPYPVDDALSFGRAGVAVVATEYGFTRGTPNEEQARYGGDRAVATADGLARPWQDVDGQTHAQSWGAPQLFADARLAGIAPWGSPAPGPDDGLDLDTNRGITGAPDESGLWSAWASLGASLDAADRAAGPSAACLAYRSS